ncbi:ABC transporter ATP-binding protein [Streptomyces violaceusniger]|uniref:ABC transporter ATP-binding protein n=1 Tax=Streptomyces violaceusniger TaxID=68280 RepID=UPI000998C8B5|nr:ABC transporter ATP-binding protein [Streptomyces hygroscopicus]AQW52982.1 peptide ABC transporter ATP-binding protein [Streptomyces hygroscopicus]
MTPSAPPALSVRDLSVVFRTPTRVVHAVDGLSYDIAAGEVLAVVGESGCGKSVTSTAVMGLLPPTAHVGGSIRLGGRELVGADEKELRDVRGREIAMIFQEPMTSLNPVLTIGRQVGEVLRRHQGLDRRAARERAVDLLDLVGIPAPAQRARDYPHQLSGGMRQRVMIAIAIACDPAVLIADEPTTALDVTVQAGILEVLQSLRERLGTAIVLITHDLGVVADIADRVLVMYAGRGVEQAPVDELFTAPGHPYTRGLLGAVPVPGRRRAAGGRGRLQEIPGLVPSLTEQPDRCTFQPRCSAADERCGAQRPVLRALRERHEAACWYPVPVDSGQPDRPEQTEGTEPTERPDQEAAS